jgi:hypothetical protein
LLFSNFYKVVQQKSMQGIDNKGHNHSTTKA